jgi:hypothetical protein
VLRRIPIIELNTPTVVLVGAPNVGKSTIVRAVSSGTPEVSVFLWWLLLKCVVCSVCALRLHIFVLNFVGM